MKEKRLQPFMRGLKNLDAPNNRQDNIEHVRNWLDYQPHLPQITDDHLHMFLHACYDNLEKTKHMLESFFTFRTLTPEMFRNRDVTRADFRNAMNLCELIVLPQVSPEGYQVGMFRITDTDASKFVYLDGLKALFMAVDFYVSEYGLHKGSIVAFDLKGLNLGHLARLYPIPLIRKAFFYIQECMPVRLKAVHVFNSGTLIEKLLNIVRPFFTTEMAEMIHIHATLDPMLKYVPQEILPEEYGGKAGSMTTMFNELRSKLIIDYADWLLESEELKTDESKRIGKSTVRDTLFGVEGSFRKLELD